MRRQILAVLIFTLFGTKHLVLSNEIVYCPEGKFLPIDGAECMDCSRCPDNQIVRETCWQRRDTVCGTFTEFQPFHRENDLETLHNANVINDLNVVTHQETGANVTSSWQTASLIMIVLLSVTTVVCAILIGTVCYRCKRDKKDGLMIYVEKDSTESPAPGCSDAASQYSGNADDVTARVPRYSPAPQPSVSANDKNVEKYSKILPVQRFEITEEKPNT